MVRGVQSDEFRLHARPGEQLLRIIEGHEVLVAKEGNDSGAVGADVRAQQHRVDQRQVLPDLRGVLLGDGEVNHRGITEARGVGGGVVLVLETLQLRQFHLRVSGKSGAHE